MLGNSVVHGVLLEYASCVPDTRRDALVASLHDVTMHMAHTAAGSKVAMFSCFCLKFVRSFVFRWRTLWRATEAPRTAS
jgi:hypothetical protein